MSLRIRRGTDAQRTNPGITPDQGELIYTTDTKKLFIGDGSTLGGVNIGQSLAGTGLVFDSITQTLQATAPQSSGITSVSSDLNPSLGGNLNLNNKNITGTGTIGIVGTMYASQGLGGDLSLNTHSITGTGGINITGTLSVTGLGSDLSLNSHNITGTGNITTTGTLSVTGLGTDLSLNGHNITGTGNITTTGTLSVTGLGSDLVLNSQNITGTGNMNITGAITASGAVTGSTFTSGNLNVNSNVLSVSSGILTIKNSNLSIASFVGVSDGSQTHIPGANFYSSRGTLSAPTSSQAGDYPFVINLGGYNASTGYQSIASITCQYDPTATMSNSNPGSNIGIITNNNNGGVNVAFFDKRGAFGAPIFWATSYTTTAMNAIPNPAAGMIIFNSSVNHFYGYNGTSWVAFTGP